MLACLAWSVILPVELIFLLWNHGQLFAFPSHIFYVPFSLEMATLIGSWDESSKLATCWTSKNFLLFLLYCFLFATSFLPILLLNFFVCFFFFLFLLASFNKRLESAKLIIFQTFSRLINHNIDHNFHRHIGIFLAHQIQFSVLIRLDVIHPRNSISLYFLTLECFNA